jgi:hypothetical protein
MVGMVFHQISLELLSLELAAAVVATTAAVVMAVVVL